MYKVHVRSKLKLAMIIGSVVAVFALGIVQWDTFVMVIRHFFFRAKGGAVSLVSSKPQGDLVAARVCRENLHRIQTAKRKAAQERGQPIGIITWEEITAQLAGAPKRLTPDAVTRLIPRCPSGGTYSAGTLEEVPRCSVSGQGTISIADDHIIRD